MKHLFSKAILFCLLTILTSLSSCKKEEDKQPELPPETTSGANTAGFVVNDKIVILPSNSISPALPRKIALAWLCRVSTMYSASCRVFCIYKLMTNYKSII